MFSEQCQWAERALMSPGSSIFIDSVQTVAKAVIKKSLAYLGHSHQKLEFWAQLRSLQTTEKGWHSQRVWTWRACPSSAPLYEGQREWDHHKDSSNKRPGQWCTGCSLGKVCHQPFTRRFEHNWSPRVTEKLLQWPDPSCSHHLGPMSLLLMGNRKFLPEALHSSAHFFQKVIHASNWFPWPWDFS